MNNRPWIVAANRFGLGGSSQDLWARKDPVGWLRQQVEHPDLPENLQHLPTVAAHFETIFGARIAAKKDQMKVVEARQALGRAIHAEAENRIVAAIMSRTSFVERWVWFWSNHFSVSWRALIDKVMGALAGAFEREVIRSNAFGRFEDMLMASTKSPAMGFYLDNISSVGPNSPAGKRSKLGLNENLAREILELHTLGVDGGYGQADVIALAGMITGWTFGKPGVGGGGAVFEFRPLRHEPGPKKLLGVSIPDSGLEQGERALRLLAAHPNTARFVARKLARHFVSDNPPPAATARLERVFIETKGDLRALALAAIDLNEAWDNFQQKFRTPLEFLVAAYRIAGLPANTKSLVTMAGALQQVPFTAPSPAGWPDIAQAWATPDAIVRRVDVSAAISSRIPVSQQSQAIDIALDTAATPAIHDALKRVSPHLKMALIFASPEFQKR